MARSRIHKNDMNSLPSVTTVMFKIIMTVFILTAGFKSTAQDGPKRMGKEIPRHDNAVLDQDYEELNMDADFQVLDGIMWNKKRVPEELVIYRTLVLRESKSIRKLGIQPSNGSYKLLFSEITDFYRHIYSRTQIPLDFKDLNLPLIFNGKLILPNDYDKLKKIHKSAIKETVFLPKSKLLKWDQIVYGAIVVRTE